MIDRACPRVLLTALALLAAAGCQQNKSANPLSPDIAGPIPGVTISAPQAVSPVNGQQVMNTLTTVEFVFRNPQSSGVRPVWIQFQLAADANFQQVVHQADRVSPGQNGQTTYRLSDRIGSAGTYFWRVRGLDGANTGPFSPAASFAVAEPVIIDPPVPQSPIGQQSTTTPEFRLQNGRVSGPARDVVYRVEVASSPDPSSIIAVLTAPRNASGTTVIAPGASLPPSTTYYWRAYGTDGEVTSAYSAIVSFRTGTGSTPSPTPTPTPTPGPVGGQRTISEGEVLTIVKSVHDRLGFNLGSGSSRDYRNGFLASAMAAVHYGHGTFNPQGGDRNWCIKDSGGGRPQSDDVIVRCNTRDAWDIIGGSGANGYSFHLDYIGRLPSDQNVYPPPQSALPR